MTTPATHPPATPRWRVLLLAALTALLALLFGAGTASAAALPAAETRVGAISPAVTTVVGVAEHIAAGQHQVRAPSQSQIVVGHCVATEGKGGGLLAGLKGRYRAVRMGGGDAGSISLGGAEFSDDEIAQLTYQHIGAGDIAGRPALDEISAALAKGERVPLEGQNAFKYEYGGVRVIVNGDAPWRSTAYYPGR